MEYLDSENHPESCKFHLGNPVFHEGYKYWSCCPKKTINFQDFLEIPPCSVGPHTEHLETLPPKEKPSSSLDGNSISSSLRDTFISTTIPPTRNASTTTTTATTTTTTSTTTNNPIGIERSPVAEVPERIQEDENEGDDPPDVIVPSGTTCVRRGCGVVFSGSATLSEPCRYHRGFAVFHEGAKGWSCCGKTTSDFERFLEMTGCAVASRHKFTRPSSLLEARFDWHQTNGFVVVTIYAKAVDPHSSKVLIEPQKLKWELQLKGGQKCIKEIYLQKPINSAASTYEILSVKVEVKLKKCNMEHWESLEKRRT